MTVFVNYSCGIGPYLDPVKVRDSVFYLGCKTSLRVLFLLLVFFVFVFLRDVMFLKVAGVRRKFGPYSVHHTLREAVQQILNCAKDDSVVLPFVQPAAVTQFLGVTGKHFSNFVAVPFPSCNVGDDD